MRFETYPEYDRLCRGLAAELMQERRRIGMRGDQVADAYRPEAGRRAQRALQESLARQIARAHAGPRSDFLDAVRARVPSAKPSSLKKRRGGIPGAEARHRLMKGDIEDWGVQRLLAVADALGLEAQVVLKPKSRNRRAA